MFRMNPKPWVDNSTPTNMHKNFDVGRYMKGSAIIPKRPFEAEKEYEHSPIPKAKRELVPHVNPTYRSANYAKAPDSAPVTKVTQSFRQPKTENSLEIPFLTKESQLPYYEPTKCSSNRNGIIKAYAANTNQGIVREYNEDRVSIILNIIKPQGRVNENWPKCSYFGVYDGHGGSACADFLRDNLHQFVIREPDFPWNPYEALRKGFEAAEKSFLDLALQSYAKGHAERSGSCAIVSLIVGDTCFIANVGDSRAVLSSLRGKQVYTLSRDHKPCDEQEQQRIQMAGGKIYQTQGCSGPEEDAQIILGPLRVLPGRLSVSRTFGDIEAKLEQFGGNPKVVVAEPEIRSFKIQLEHDFLVLASDGIFDKMSSGDVLRTIWEDMNSVPQNQQNLHSQVSSAVEAVLKESINRRTFDNITVVMVAFQKEDDRPRTAGSVERDQQTSSVSPTPVSKPAPAMLYHNIEKGFLRGSAQQSKPQPLMSYNKPLRSSLENIEYNKKQLNPHQMYSCLNIQSFSYYKQDQQKLKYDENKENYAYMTNKVKELKASSHHMDLKLSNDFRQVKRVVPITNDRYKGRIQ